MDRRTFLATAAALAATPAYSQQLSLNDLSRYLRTIELAQSDFTQVNPDGTLATGTFYIKRPGRMRFEYDPPEKLLVIAGAGQVGIFDGKSNSGRAERYPLRRTPLNLILEKNVNLARRNMVVGHDFDGTATVVTAQDPEHPEYGTIAMRFGGDPVSLREWTITNEYGEKTTVRIDDLQPVDTLSNFLFDIRYERQRRK